MLRFFDSERCLMWKFLALISIMNIAAKVACLVAGRMENLNTEGISACQKKYSVLIDAGTQTICVSILRQLWFADVRVYMEY